MAYHAKKTKSSGGKHRRRQGKRIMHEEQQIPEREKVDKLRAAFRASAGGWKGLLDAEELIRNIHADRLINTRPVPRLHPPEEDPQSR